MADSDPIRGSKVAKPKTAEKVAVGGEKAATVETVPSGEPREGDGAGVDDNFDPPGDKPKEPPTSQETAEAQSEVPKIEVLVPVIPPTYVVRAGGRAWYRGQQIKFTTGETFTSETWDENAITGFRECGVTIEQIAP